MGLGMGTYIFFACHDNHYLINEKEREDKLMSRQLNLEQLNENGYSKVFDRNLRSSDVFNCFH